MFSIWIIAHIKVDNMPLLVIIMIMCLISTVFLNVVQCFVVIKCFGSVKQNPDSIYAKDFPIEDLLRAIESTLVKQQMTAVVVLVIVIYPLRICSLADACGL